MIQTILIVLVAVVVLIVIIAVLALRYLRADDSDTFDDIPDEPRPARPAEQGRERRPTSPARRPRQPEQATEVWAADRPARTPDSRVPAGFRDRDTEARPTGPQRAATQATARREPAGTRPVRASARPDGPDSVTSSWDSLSDVDYWAELAADKPEITPAVNGAATASRHGSEPASDIRPAAARPAARADRADSGQLPIRKRHLPSRQTGPSRLTGAPSARAADSGQTEQIDVRAAQAQPAAARFPSDPAASSPNGLGRHGQSRHGTGSRPDVPAAQQQRPSGAQRPGGPRQAPATQPTYPTRGPAPAAPAYANGHGPADDDPLTSPSFPAINTADSRSYRTRRSGGATQPGASGQHTRPAAGPADQGSTSHQFIDYSSAPRRAASRSDGYPLEPARAPGQPAAPAAGHQPPAAPAANPYGSYVSQPESAYSEAARPQTGYSSAGYSDTPAPILAAASYGGYAAGQQAASANWYTAPAIASGSPQAAVQPLGQPTDGYLPAAGLGGTGLAGGSHVMNGSPARGYTGIDYSSIRYDDPVYPDGPGVLPGYGAAGQHTTQYERPGYGAQDPGSGQDGYGAYPGYGTGGR